MKVRLELICDVDFGNVSPEDGVTVDSVKDELSKTLVDAVVQGFIVESKIHKLEVVVL